MALNVSLLSRVRVRCSQLYNSLTVPHSHALVPAVSFLNCGKRKQVYLLYFKFAKYLIELPTWTSKSFLQRKYQMINPAGVIDNCICDFATECQKSSHLWSFLFVPCLQLSKCAFYLYCLYFVFTWFLLSFSGLSAQFFCDGL